MTYYIKQLGDKDCGYTCVKMLLAIINKNKDFLYYPTPSIDESASLSDLMKYASKEHVTLSVSRIINKDEMFVGKTPCPFLIPIKKGDSFHMVLVKKVNKRGFKIYDPSLGIYFLNKKKAMEIWNGELIEISKANYTSYRAKKVEVVPKFNMFITIVFQIFSFVFLMTSMLFLDSFESDTVFIPISLFALYILFEFMYQKSTINSLKNFDKAILLDDYVFKKNKFNKYFEPMNKFKFTMISSPLELVNCFLILFFGLLILGLNNYFNFLILGLIFIVQIIFKLYEKTTLNPKIEEIAEHENFVSKNAEKLTTQLFKDEVNYINQETYKVVSYMSFKKYFLILLTLSLCLIYQLTTGFLTINFMLFHFFLYIYIEENFDKVINFNKIINNMRYYKCLYLHYFR